MTFFLASQTTGTSDTVFFSHFSFLCFHATSLFHSSHLPFPRRERLVISIPRPSSQHVASAFLVIARIYDNPALTERS
jgi:hypothetical protein